jgi:hypothetical protein
LNQPLELERLIGLLLGYSLREATVPCKRFDEQGPPWRGGDNPRFVTVVLKAALQASEHPGQNPNPYAARDTRLQSADGRLAQSGPRSERALAQPSLRPEGTKDVPELAQGYFTHRVETLHDVTHAGHGRGPCLSPTNQSV